jgi:hypothetical protein
MVGRAAVTVAAAVILAVGGYVGSATSQPFAPAHALCGAGYVDGVIGGVHKCLRAGEFCSAGHEPDYERYGFTCVDGHLKSRTSSTTTGPVTTTPTQVPALGRTVRLGRHTQTRGCTRGALPDRQCSPGAFYSRLTKAVLCSSTFRTGTIRNVPVSEKHQVEVEYGMTPRSYGRAIEIDHIVSLELGGSNDIANLYPEPGSGPSNYHVKDKLENRLHRLVCAGAMTLHAAQAGIARNWEELYRVVFGPTP